MSPCHEIVQFAFAAGTPLDAQRAHMASIGAFARGQPGFLARACYADAVAGRWVDHVTWVDEAAAKAAAARIGSVAELSDALAAIDAGSVSMGHYRESA